jgi:hypothetical protein
MATRPKKKSLGQILAAKRRGGQTTKLKYGLQQPQRRYAKFVADYYRQAPSV